jgi:hypothetical protein
LRRKKSLKDLFSLPGFTVKKEIQGKFGETKARILELKRQKKERSAQDVEKVTALTTMQKLNKCEIWMYLNGEFTSNLNNGGYRVLTVEE